MIESKSGAEQLADLERETTETKKVLAKYPTARFAGQLSGRSVWVVPHGDMKDRHMRLVFMVNEGPDGTLRVEFSQDMWPMRVIELTPRGQLRYDCSEFVQSIIGKSGAYLREAMASCSHGIHYEYDSLAGFEAPHKARIAAEPAHEAKTGPLNVEAASDVTDEVAVAWLSDVIAYEGTLSGPRACAKRILSMLDRSRRTAIYDGKTSDAELDAVADVLGKMAPGATLRIDHDAVCNIDGSTSPKKRDAKAGSVDAKLLAEEMAKAVASQSSGSRAHALAAPTAEFATIRSKLLKAAERCTEEFFNRMVGEDDGQYALDAAIRAADAAARLS